MPRFVERVERTFVDAEGVTIHFHVWPVVAPTAIVQLQHGLGEYAARYEPFAQDLANAGFAVWAADARGHGRTGLEQHGGDASKLGRLGPGGIRATVAGLRRFTDLIRSENAGAPLALLGHSWGSLLAQLILAESAAPFDAVVLSGTAFRTFRHMNSGDLARRHAVRGGPRTEWLSRDVAVQTAFATDPLTFAAQATKLFGIREGLRLLGTPRALDRDVPVLLQVGEDDSFGGPRSVQRLAGAYRAAGVSDVTVQVYPDARHEIYNELNRDEVIADLIAWLDGHLKYVPPRRRR
ncbi:MAG: alpha/beta hydrolase [Micrococcales bacterium]|nr:alpha/beta hydrolase [Micrococcales bacterium]